jgi:hypothetical protein
MDEQWKLEGRGTPHRVWVCASGDYSIEPVDGSRCRGIPHRYRVYHLDGNEVKKIGSRRTLTEAKAFARAHAEFIIDTRDRIAKIEEELNKRRAAEEAA